MAKSQRVLDDDPMPIDFDIFWWTLFPSELCDQHPPGLALHYVALSGG
jgi:hypothetical protein